MGEMAPPSPCIFRQWGYYQILALTPKIKIKKLVIMPGKSTSLQYHRYRDEFWTIISGQVHARINHLTYVLRAEDTLWVKAEEIHQLSNQGAEQVIMHEIQQGPYIEEDDIVRLAPWPMPNLPEGGADIAHYLPN